MTEEHDSGVTAASALVGGVATLIQELVVTGAVDPVRLQSRLETFLAQDAIKAEPEADQELIQRVIGTLLKSIDFGSMEREDNDR